jgi:hypothetical protein
VSAECFLGVGVVCLFVAVLKYCLTFLFDALPRMDEDDSLERGKERLKRRKERWNKRIRYDDEKNPYRLEPIEDTLILVEMERFLHEDGSLLPKATDRFANRFRRSSGRTSSRKRRR